MRNQTAASIRPFEAFALFVRFGLLAYGGPIAHIAMFRQDIVERRSLLTDSEFLRIVGAVHFLPGPNSSQAAMVIGYRLAGIRGLIAAAGGFILPGALAVTGLVYLYGVSRSSTAWEDAPSWFEPAALGIIAAAVVSMSTRILRSASAVASFAVAAVVGFAGFHPVSVLLAGVVAGVVAIGLESVRSGRDLKVNILPIVAFVPVGPELRDVASFFLRLGFIVFGGGYVLLAYLSADLVESAGWITERELLHAVAISQIAPGPLFTVATVIGFMVRGGSGALVATIAVFVPSLVMTWLVGKRLEHSVGARGRFATAGRSLFPAALGLMTAVMLGLGRALELRATGWIVMVGVFSLSRWTRLPAPVVMALGALTAWGASHTR